MECERYLAVRRFRNSKTSKLQHYCIEGKSKLMF